MYASHREDSVALGAKFLVDEAPVPATGPHVIPN